MKFDLYQHFILTICVLFIAVNLVMIDLKIFSPQNDVSVKDVSISVTDSPTNAPYETVITATPLPAKINTSEKTLTEAKEIYVPLGSGSTKNVEWDDLITTDTLIDSSKYGSILEMYLIATLSNPTQNGQIDAQLVNVTDKHPVWFSQLVLNGPKKENLISPKIQLDPGTKLYRMQLKSSLGAEVLLENAKLRIIAE